MGWVIAAVVVATLVVGIYVLHRVLVWAEGRGWIYYRSKDRPRGAFLGILEEIYHPAVSHVVVEASDEAIRADQPESGEDPDPGADSATGP